MILDQAIANNKGRAATVVAAIQDWNKAIPQSARFLKYHRMLSRPLVFFRGTNHLFWSDLANDKRIGRFGNKKTKTWIQGDLHPYNFGTYHDAHLHLVYGLNDFDDAIVADYQYDLWRMATGILLVAEQNHVRKHLDMRAVTGRFAQSYLDKIKDHRKKPPAKQFTTSKAGGKLKRYMQYVTADYNRIGMLNRWAPEKNGERQLNIARTKLAPLSKPEHEALVAAIEPYRARLSDATLASDITHFRVKSTARRLHAGTGSLGAERFYLLIEGGKSGRQLDDRILDIKEQQAPTASHFLKGATTASTRNAAERMVEAQQAMLLDSDPYLGWLTLNGRHFSVRERSPYKEAFPGEWLVTKKSMEKMVTQWGAVLAAAHIRAAAGVNASFASDVHELCKHQQKNFHTQLWQVAAAYADQVVEDWGHFREAIGLPSA